MAKVIIKWGKYLNMDKQRADKIGLSLAVDYFFPVQDCFEIGISAKSYLTLSGLEPVSLTPNVTFMIKKSGPHLV